MFIRNIHINDKIVDSIILIIEIMLLIFILFPIIWMIRTSIISVVDIYKSPPLIFFKPTLSAYIRAFEGQYILKRFMNSALIAFSATGLCLLTGSMAAYSITRFQLPMRRILPQFFLFLRILPIVAIMIPIFDFFNKFGLMDTYVGVILIYVACNLSFVIWMMWGFYKDLPKEIEESAYIDGSSHSRTFFEIILPITTPAIASVGILCFTYCWNEFLLGVILTRRTTITLPTAVYSLMTNTDLSWNLIAAAGVYVSFPIMILCIFAQKYFVKGLTVGAVKG